MCWMGCERAYDSSIGRLQETIIESVYIEMSDSSTRHREHRECKEKLENIAFEEDMDELLNTSEPTETKALVRCFLKEIVVGSGRAVIPCSLPIPGDSPIGSVDNAEVALNVRVMGTARCGTPGGTRTHASSSGGWRSIL